jgi:hypothetical protein
MLLCCLAVWCSLVVLAGRHLSGISLGSWCTGLDFGCAMRNAQCLWFSMISLADDWSRIALVRIRNLPHISPDN